MKIITMLFKWKFPLLLGLVLSFFYVHFFENRAYVELQIEVSKKSWFNIYWAGEGENYSKSKRARVRLKPGKQHYRFHLTDLRRVERLRIDPHKFKGDVVIKKLLFRQNGLQNIRFDSESSFSAIKPFFHIDTCQPRDDGLHVSSTGNDPQLVYMVNIQRVAPKTGLVAARIGTIFLVVFLFFGCTESFRQEERFIPLFFAVAFSAAIIMAATSKNNVHPDEYVHQGAAQFYKSNWLPPEVDDPKIAKTYSLYGVSRLNSSETAYFFIGKLVQIIAPLKLSNTMNYRIFNLLLLGLILLYVLKSSEIALLAAPFLISAQIWYVFSYCNSDAFSLAISFFVACQLAIPKSSLNSYLMGCDKKKVVKVLLFSFVCCLLLLMKKNYLFYLIFLLGYLGWRLLFQVAVEKRRQFVKRFLLLLCLGIAFASLRIGVDYMVNGMDRSTRIAAMQEKYAAEYFKPSTPLEKKHSFLYRKARGDSLQKIITVDRWFEKTFMSSFGLYGYFTAAGSDTYYNCVRWTGVGLLLVVVMGVLLKGGRRGNLLMLWLFTCSCALIGASLYHSWTKDFQTQGRYLFPILPMLAIFVFHSRHMMSSVMYKMMLTSMFLLSVYSFVFVALFQLPKVS